MNEETQEQLIDVFGTKSFTEFLDEIVSIRTEVADFVTNGILNYNRIPEIAELLSAILFQINQVEQIRQDIAEIIKPDYVDFCRAFELLDQIDEIMTALEDILAEVCYKHAKSF